MLRRFRLPAAAVAAGLPALLAGMLAAPTATVLVGPDDTMVRTVNVDPPPSAPTDEDLGLDGAHPPVDTAPQLVDGSSPGRRRRPQPRPAGRGCPARRSRPGCCSPTATPPPRCARSDPACHLHWSLVAGIGKVESGHAYDGALDRRGRTTVADPRAGAQRGGRRRRDRRHRRRAVRRRHHLGPRGGADAVHPVVLGGLGPGRRRRRHAATRPTSTTPRWPPRRYLCAGDRDLERRERPPQRRLQLQPLVGLRRPGAGLGRRLRHRHDAGRARSPPPATVGAERRSPPAAATDRRAAAPPGRPRRPHPAPTPDAAVPREPPASAAPPSGEPEPAPSRPVGPRRRPQPGAHRHPAGALPDRDPDRQPDRHRRPATRRPPPRRRRRRPTPTPDADPDGHRPDPRRPDPDADARPRPAGTAGTLTANSLRARAAAWQTARP